MQVGLGYFTAFFFFNLVAIHVHGAHCPRARGYSLHPDAHFWGSVAGLIVAFLQ